MKILSLILILMLTACGGGGDDISSPEETPKYHVEPAPVAPAKPNCATTYPCQS